MYDSVQSYGFGTKIKAFWARFSRQIFHFYSLFLGHTKQPVQWTIGTKNEVRRSSYNNTDLAHFSRQILVGLFWCCEVFSLAGNVYLFLFCNFLKLNNRSLSLSHCVSPH
jgi:hypothetical protein